MALKAYEDLCLRAELFGQPKPDKEEFLEKNKHLDITEFEEVNIKTAENTAMLNDDLKTASSGLGELNTILTSTQTKISRLKGVCGSLTNFFRVKVSNKDNISYSSDPSYVGQTNYDKDSVPGYLQTDLGSINKGLGPDDNEMTLTTSQNDGLKNQNGGGITAALKELDKMEQNEKTSVLKDVGQKMSSHMSALDNLLNQSERAENSMQHQNKDMRSFLR